MHRRCQDRTCQKDRRLTFLTMPWLARPILSAYPFSSWLSRALLPCAFSRLTAFTGYLQRWPPTELPDGVFRTGVRPQSIGTCRQRLVWLCHCHLPSQECMYGHTGALTWPCPPGWWF